MDGADGGYERRHGAVVGSDGGATAPRPVRHLAAAGGNGRRHSPFLLYFKLFVIII